SLYTIQHHFDTAVNFNEGTTRDRWQLLIQSLSNLSSITLNPSWGKSNVCSIRSRYLLSIRQYY
ncbi:MAG TPA: hypothetical protein VLB84_14505, partial [Bacteroidia bacterium]|nr:hypothetical protein [Bacteroidia bacterium]